MTVDADVVGVLLHFLRSFFRSQADLEAENVVLRQQLIVAKRRAPKRVAITGADRLILVWLCRLWPRLLNLMVIVRPETVLRWHRAGFRTFWRWKSRSAGGRPKTDVEGNHAPEIAAIDLFVVPTIGFKLLYALIILRLDRRLLIWIDVTANPTAEWIARQIGEAFPWDEAPSYLIRDNDGAYGGVYQRRLRALGIRDRPTAPRSPWQNGYVERLIGSVRR